MQLEHFNYTFPNSLALEYLFNWHAFNMGCIYAM
jgi:hypothetical protein